MPQINNIPEVLYHPNQPYHYYYDNLPLKNILKRIDLVNSQVDVNTDALRGSAGTAGSINNRLEVALEPSGALKKEAVDSCGHSIASHSDTEHFVRMTVEERAKLEGVANDANNIKVKFPSYLFENGTVEFLNSNTVTFEVSTNGVTANVDFPLESAHRHHYGVDPVLTSGASYKTAISGGSFKDGSLRVYVNGFRISDDSVRPPKVLIPPASSSSSSGLSWLETYVVSQNGADGTFTLNRVLGASEFVRVDFDKEF